MADCFPIINGTPFVNLDQNTPLRDSFRFTHWIVNATIGLSSLFLNTILFYLIQTKSGQMNSMRPLLNISCIIDLFLSITNSMAGPVMVTSHGHFTCFWNGLFPTKNRYLVALTTSVIGWFTISSWGFLPIQFLYRLEVIKNGHRPRGFKLAGYVFLGMASLFGAMFMAFNMYINPAEWYRINAAKILRNSGYDVSGEIIVGAHITDPKMKTYTNYFTTVMFIGYSVIIYAEIVRRRYLKHLYDQMSNSSKRMNRDLNRVFLALAICPIVASVIPSFYINSTIIKCSHLPFPMIIHSWVLASTPLVNAITTLVFIRPYRRQIMKWLNLADKNARVRDDTTNVHTISKEHTIKADPEISLNVL